jgi:hypothetical protein
MFFQSCIHFCCFPFKNVNSIWPKKSWLLLSNKISMITLWEKNSSTWFIIGKDYSVTIIINKWYISQILNQLKYQIIL